MKHHNFGARSRRNLHGTETTEPVKPITVKLCVLALLYTEVDFTVIDGHRGMDVQNALYVSGASELDGINNLSDHQYGFAIDVIPVIVVDGVRYDPFDVHLDVVRLAWMEVYRAFMRAAMKLNLSIEFGFGYNIGGGRDWPHISIKSKVGKDFKGLT